MLWELVRDVALALPASCPAGVLPVAYAGVCIGLLRTLGLAPLPAGDTSGSSSSTAAAPPLTSAEWAAVELFAVLSPALCAVATPPSQLDRALLHEAGSVVHRAILRLLPLFDRAVHSCGLKQLQLMSGVAGEAACQLPLLVAGWEAERAPTAESRLRLGVVSLALLDPTLGAALRLACPTPSKPSGSRGDPSPEAAAAAAAAATSLLQQMHLRLCKAAHFCAASDPAEHAERAAQAALAQAGQVLGLRLADCFKALQLAFWKSGASSGALEGGR